METIINSCIIHKKCGTQRKLKNSLRFSFYKTLCFDIFWEVLQRKILMKCFSVSLFLHFSIHCSNVIASSWQWWLWLQWWQWWQWWYYHQFRASKRSSVDSGAESRDCLDVWPSVAMRQTSRGSLFWEKFRSELSFKKWLIQRLFCKRVTWIAIWGHLRQNHIFLSPISIQITQNIVVIIAYYNRNHL